VASASGSGFKLASMLRGTVIMPKSTRKPRSGKPAKPRADFALFIHQTGRWCKKVKGRFCYFGKAVDDPNGKAALNKWLDEKDDLLAGRIPRKTPAEGVTVKDLVNHFLTLKQSMVEAGELMPRTFELYRQTGLRFAKAVGRGRPVDDLVADDFQHYRTWGAKQWGPVFLGNEIQRIRTLFKHGYDAGLIDKPVRFGPGFKKPSAKTLRQSRLERGLRMFERDELLSLLKHAEGNVGAMTLLGINAALSNTDLALLPMKALDLKSGWLDYARQKTAIERRIPLWPETVESLNAVLAGRPTPQDPADKQLVFIGKRGESYIGNHRGYRVHQEFKRLLERANLTRKGLSFYALRHTFQTIAEGSRDLSAVQSIMGHAPQTNDMSAVYRERIDDARLKAVTDHVHAWLFGDNTK
jgi:integrase